MSSHATQLICVAIHVNFGQHRQKDSYFPLRKLDLKRFAEATKPIWINNWIFGHFGQTSSQLSKLLSRQDFTKDYSK